MREDEEGFVGVGFRVCKKGGFSDIIIVVVVIIGGIIFGEIAALSVVEDEGFAGVVCVLDGVGEVGEEAVGDAGGGDEGGGVHVVGGETHYFFVHAVLDFEHAFYGGAVEGEEAVEEGGF